MRYSGFKMCPCDFPLTSKLKHKNTHMAICAPHLHLSPQLSPLLSARHRSSAVGPRRFGGGKQKEEEEKNSRTMTRIRHKESFSEAALPSWQRSSDFLCAQCSHQRVITWCVVSRKAKLSNTADISFEFVKVSHKLDSADLWGSGVLENL